MQVNSRLAVLLLLCACQPSGDAPINSGGQTTAFSLPSITQVTQSVTMPEPLRADSVHGVLPHLVGRFGFASNIVLEKPDSLGRNDFIMDDFRRYIGLEDSSTLSTDGLELIANHAQSLVYQHPGKIPARYASLFPPHLTFPVYLINSSPRSKILYGKDSWVFAVQEAKDRTGQWRPIEGKGADFCGNGRWAMKIHPRQLVVFLMDKYQGSFKTLLRVRLQNGESRYVSAPYSGQINERQFQISHWDYHTLEENPSAVNWLYYGAEPAAVDSIELKAERAE